MAKIELGPLVSNIQGSIRSVTFRRIGSRHYATPKSAGPVNAGRNSTRHHLNIKLAKQAWYTLAEDVREFWRRYHAAEHPICPRTHRTFSTAFDLFTSYQLIRLTCGLTVLTDTVPTPPIFNLGFMSWVGPFAPSVHDPNGYMFITREPEMQGPMDAAAFFFAYSDTGARPGRFPRLVFPTPQYGPGRAVLDSNVLIYDAVGYPPGIPLENMAIAPPGLYSLLSAWGVHNNKAYWAHWAPQDEAADVFIFPPPAPNVLT